MQSRDPQIQEKKLFADNLEAIASGKVTWPELRSQIEPVPATEPVSMADQSYQGKMESLDEIIRDLRATTSTFTQPDPGSAA